MLVKLAQHESGSVAGLEIKWKVGSGSESKRAGSALLVSGIITNFLWIILRFADNCFSGNYITTIGVDFKIRNKTTYRNKKFYNWKNFKLKTWLHLLISEEDEKLLKKRHLIIEHFLINLFPLEMYFCLTKLLGLLEQ